MVAATWHHPFYVQLPGGHQSCLAIVGGENQKGSSITSAVAADLSARISHGYLFSPVPFEVRAAGGSGFWASVELQLNMFSSLEIKMQCRLYFMDKRSLAML